MIKKNKIEDHSKKFYSGFILPTSLFFMFASAAVIMVYYNWLSNQLNELDYRIAVTKATYNAESGIAEKAFPYLLQSNYVTGTVLEGRSLDVEEIGLKMGSYREVTMTKNNLYNERIGSAIGLATWGPNNLDTIFRKSEIVGSPEGLGKYMYFTNTERAGGAPMTFGPPGFVNGERRGVKFYGSDVIDGIVQTNDEIYFSDTGCPDFSEAEWYLTPGNNGPANGNWGGCSGNGWNALFSPQEVDTSTRCELKWPPPGYENMKQGNADSQLRIIPAGIINRGGNGAKDTLTMTEIEFFNTGEYMVTQWWFLPPPHLKSGLSSTQVINPYPQHLDGFNELCNSTPGCNPATFNYNDDKAAGFPILDQICVSPTETGDPTVQDISIYGCKPYLDSLMSYHGKYMIPNNIYDNPQIETLMDPFSSNGPYFDDPECPPGENCYPFGPHGIAGQHFDFEHNVDNPNNPNLPINTLPYPGAPPYIYNSQGVIYVEDGPVRVKGNYKGRYSIVTDPYTLYRRHACNDSILNCDTELDTMWNNIWIIDDLVNADTDGSGNMALHQPNLETCRGGSNNVLGLVSGANIVVANTPENGANNGCPSGNCPYPTSSHGVRINAHMIALNESFVAHYWQNSSNSIPTNPGWVGNIYDPYFTPNDEFDRDTGFPPWADGRGRNTANGTGGSDRRGTILLWGGVCQRYRGYVQRNPTSQYGNQLWVGYQIKDYNYDDNLLCGGPPAYPVVECKGGNGEISINIVSAKTSKGLE